MNLDLIGEGIGRFRARLPELAPVKYGWQRLRNAKLTPVFVRGDADELTAHLEGLLGFYLGLYTMPDLAAKLEVQTIDLAANIHYNCLSCTLKIQRYDVIPEADNLAAVVRVSDTEYLMACDTHITVWALMQRFREIHALPPLDAPPDVFSILVNSLSHGTFE